MRTRIATGATSGTGEASVPALAYLRQSTPGLHSDSPATDIRVWVIEPGLIETESTPVQTGDPAASERMYACAHPMPAARVLWIAKLPPHRGVNPLEIMPVSQSFPGLQVAREEKL